jgi:hypothetical protein
MLGDFAAGTDVSVAAGWEGPPTSELVLWEARLCMRIRVVAVTLWRWVSGSQRFEGWYCLCLEGSSSPVFRTA